MSRSILLIGYLAAAAITVVAVYLLTTGGEDEKRSVGSARELVGGGLVTANRDRLAICVEDVAAGASESEAKARVEIALIEVQRNPLWENAGFGNRDPLVEVGCPSPPLLLQPDVEVIDARKGSELEIRPKDAFVVEASYYRVFFFMVPRETIAETFGSAQQYVTQEYLRLGDHEEMAVTTGLYISPDGLAERELLIYCLTRVLGLHIPGVRYSCSELP